MKFSKKLTGILMITALGISSTLMTPDMNAYAAKTRYYKYLTTSQKKLYKNFRTAINKNKGKPAEFTFEENNLTDITQAIDALISDYPYLFTGDITMNYTGYSSPGNFSSGRTSDKDKLEDFKEGNSFTLEISGLNSHKEMKKVKSKLNSLYFDGDTQYEKVLNIHDWIIGNSEYDFTSKSRRNKNCLNGVFLNKKAVCEGYARAFKVLCDLEDIPCVLVSGKVNNDPGTNDENHMWNYVKLKGKWYAVDCTWDDITGQIPQHTYFLNGSNTKDYAGLPFSKTHIADEYFMTFQLPDTAGSLGFKVPELSKESYFKVNKIKEP